jgi:integrase
MKRRVGLKRTPHTSDGLTRTQAERELQRLILEVKPSLPDRGTVTMSVLGAMYVTHLRQLGRKKATVVAVESVLNIWLVPFFGERDLRSVRKQDVTDLMARMRAGKRSAPRRPGDRRYGRPVSVKTLRNYVGTLSALLTFAANEGMDVPNPVRLVKLPSVEGSEDIRFLTETELWSLTDAVADGPYRQIDRALYLTSAMAGLRQGELCALRWQDVDWTAGRIRVRQNYVLGEIGTPKSRRSSRSVPMADTVGRELDELSKLTGDGELVFPDPLTGGYLDKAAIKRRYRRAARAAKLPDTHKFHDLRHTFGTLCAANGVPMRTLQEWMGHRDFATTQIYADYAPSAHEAALIEQAFGGRGTYRGTTMRESGATERTPGPVK